MNSIKVHQILENAKNNQTNIYIQIQQLQDLLGCLITLNEFEQNSFNKSEKSSSNEFDKKIKNINQYIKELIVIHNANNIFIQTNLLKKQKNYS